MSGSEFYNYCLGLAEPLKPTPPTDIDFNEAIEGGRNKSSSRASRNRTTSRVSRCSKTGDRDDIELGKMALKL